MYRRTLYTPDLESLAVYSEKLSGISLIVKHLFHLLMFLLVVLSAPVVHAESFTAGLDEGSGSDGLNAFARLRLSVGQESAFVLDGLISNEVSDESNEIGAVIGLEKVLKGRTKAGAYFDTVLNRRLRFEDYSYNKFGVSTALFHKGEIWKFAGRAGWSDYSLDGPGSLHRASYSASVGRFANKRLFALLQLDYSKTSQIGEPEQRLSTLSPALYGYYYINGLSRYVTVGIQHRAVEDSSNSGSYTQGSFSLRYRHLFYRVGRRFTWDLLGAWDNRDYQTVESPGVAVTPIFSERFRLKTGIMMAITANTSVSLGHYYHVSRNTGDFSTERSGASTSLTLEFRM